MSDQHLNQLAVFYMRTRGVNGENMPFMTARMVIEAELKGGVR